MLEMFPLALVAAAVAAAVAVAATSWAAYERSRELPYTCFLLKLLFVILYF